MGFKEIFENFKTILTEKYFCFEGRAGRAEFWQFILSVFVIYIVLSLVSNILAQLFSLGMLLPSIGVTARRLHDVGKSGWFQLIGLIPLIGGIIVLVVCIPVGSAEENQYGAPVAKNDTPAEKQ